MLVLRKNFSIIGNDKFLTKNAVSLVFQTLVDIDFLLDKFSAKRQEDCLDDYPCAICFLGGVHVNKSLRETSGVYFSRDQKMDSGGEYKK